MTLEIQVLGWDRHIHVVVLTPLMGCQPSPRSEFNDAVFQISVLVFNCNFIRITPPPNPKHFKTEMTTEAHVNLCTIIYFHVCVGI
jgi:hypothetical protein